MSFAVLLNYLRIHETIYPVFILAFKLLYTLTFHPFMQHVDFQIFQITEFHNFLSSKIKKYLQKKNL